MIISVIIPSYNRFDTLKRCLDSITKQTLGVENYEVIVVDDCSIDRTGELVLSYINESPNKNIFYIRNDVNMGPAKTRNVGIRNAKGDLLLFLDNDLIVENIFLESHLYKHLYFNNYKLGVLSNVTYKPEYLKKSNFGTYIQSRAIGYRSNKDMEDIDLNDLPDNYFAGGGSSCTRQFAFEIGLFEEGLTKYGAEDELFGYRFKKSGGRMVFCDEARVLHDDRNVFPKFWKIKYEEMGRYSLKVLESKEPDLVKNSLYKYLLSVNLKKDNPMTIIKKSIISIFSNYLFRKSVEFYVFNTDDKPKLRIDFLYRYLTVAWMKYGYVSLKELEKVKY